MLVQRLFKSNWQVLRQGSRILLGYPVNLPRLLVLVQLHLHTLKLLKKRLRRRSMLILLLLRLAMAYCPLQIVSKGVIFWIASNAVFVFGGIAILALDAALLSQGAISLGTAYVIFQYTQILREPLGQLADETERVQRAAGGMTRTIELMAERSAI